MDVPVANAGPVGAKVVYQLIVAPGSDDVALNCTFPVPQRPGEPKVAIVGLTTILNVGVFKQEKPLLFLITAR